MRPRAISDRGIARRKCGGTTIPSIDEFEDAYSSLDNLHSCIIDELASLEGDNWGCPSDDLTEEVHILMQRLSKDLFPILDDLQKLIELKKVNHQMLVDKSDIISL